MEKKNFLKMGNMPVSIAGGWINGREGEREGRRKTYSINMASIEFLAQKRVHSIMAEKE